MKERNTALGAHGAIALDGELGASSGETLAFHALDQYAVGRIHLDRPAGAAIPAPGVVFPKVVGGKMFFAGASPTPFTAQLVTDGPKDANGRQPSHVSVDCPRGRTVTRFDGSTVVPVPVYEVPLSTDGSSNGSPRSEEHETCAFKTNTVAGASADVSVRVVCAVYKKPEDKDEPIAALLFDEAKGEPAFSGKWANAVQISRVPVADFTSGGLVRQYATGSFSVDVDKSDLGCFRISKIVFDETASGGTRGFTVTLASCVACVGGVPEVLADGMSVHVSGSSGVVACKVKSDGTPAELVVYETLAELKQASLSDRSSVVFPLYRFFNGTVVDDFRNAPRTGTAEFTYRAGGQGNS